MAIEQRRITLAGVETRSLETFGEGPVMVLLHGFSDHAGTWLHVMEHLQRENVSGVAVDLPGFGTADHLRPGSMLTQLDEFVAAAVRRWTRDGIPPVIVGNSLGGRLALRAARDPKLKLSGIVPVSPAGFGHAWFLDLLERFHWLNPLLSTPIVPMGLFRTLTAKTYTWMASGPAGVLPGVGESMAEHLRTKSDAHRIFGSAPKMLHEVRADPHESIAVDVPCLIIWGRHDRLTPIVGAQLLARLVPHAEVAILEDCGHCSQVGRPDLVAGHLVAFSRELARSIAG